MIDSQQLCEVTCSVWSSVLGTEPYAVEAPAVPGTDVLSGCVWVAGGWDGAVIIDFSPALAQRATAAMFEVDPSQATHADVVDALGEIANMIGGNVKALLPGPSTLSCPVVTHSAAEVAHSSTLHDEHFNIDGEIVRVRVIVSAPDAVGTRRIHGGTP